MESTSQSFKDEHRIFLYDLLAAVPFTSHTHSSPLTHHAHSAVCCIQSHAKQYVKELLEWVQDGKFADVLVLTGADANNRNESQLVG